MDTHIQYVHIYFKMKNGMEANEEKCCYFV